MIVFYEIFRSMQSVLHNPSLFNADSPLLKPLSNVVQQIGSMIMDGFIFKVSSGFKIVFLFCICKIIFSELLSTTFSSRLTC